MAGEKGSTQLGFRIKWGDKEIEYFGDASKDLLRAVLDCVKNSPDAVNMKDIPIIVDNPGESNPKHDLGIDDPDFEGYKRILVDTGVSFEQLQKTLIFQRKPDFEDYVPMLPAHPPQRQAVRLVTYAMQVGLEHPQVNLRLLKKVLSVNNYPFSGSALGSILVDFRRSGFVEAAKGEQRRNRPLNLTESGLEMVRRLIRRV
jgi:hypothetical protein